MIWTAFLLGILGSLHCLGMCGPIVLALPTFKKSFFSLLFSRLFYNSGRIITYGLLGLLIGLVGEGISFSGFQQKLSVFAGIVIIVLALFTNQTLLSKVNVKLTGFNFWIKSKLGAYLKKRSVFSSLLVGLANGFLPCGLVYLAMGGALAAGSWEESSLYMMVFGLGTSLAMFTLGLAGNFLGLKFKASFNRLIPYIAVFLGVLLILRGMNLGIPYISPEISTGGNVEICH